MMMMMMISKNWTRTDIKTTRAARREMWANVPLHWSTET